MVRAMRNDGEYLLVAALMPRDEAAKVWVRSLDGPKGSIFISDVLAPGTIRDRGDMERLGQTIGYAMYRGINRK